MENEPKKKTEFGAALAFFIFSLFLLVPAALGQTITLWAQHAGGVSLPIGQMYGSGSVLLLMSIFIFRRSCINARSTLALSTKLENKEQRKDKMQNQSSEPT